jgi:Ankyrin repeats (3 copies)
MVRKKNLYKKKASVGKITQAMNSLSVKSDEEVISDRTLLVLYLTCVRHPYLYKVLRSTCSFLKKDEELELEYFKNYKEITANAVPYLFNVFGKHFTKLPESIAIKFARTLCELYVYENDTFEKYEEEIIFIVTMLFMSPQYGPSFGENLTVKLHAATGAVESLKKLLADPLIDPSATHNEALIWAVTLGREKTVKALLSDPCVDPSDDEDEALDIASNDDNFEILAALLNDSRVDPTVLDPDYIRWLIRHAPSDVTDALMKHSSMGAYFDESEYDDDDDDDFSDEDEGDFDDAYSDEEDDDENEGNMYYYVKGDSIYVSLGYRCPQCGKVHAGENDDEESMDELDELIDLIENGELYELIDMVSQGYIDPSIGNNEGIIAAATLGNAGIVDFLLSDYRVDPTAQDNEAFIEACKNNHLEVVQLLLEDNRVDPSARNNAAFSKAVAAGATKILKLLLGDNRVNPSVCINRCILLAAKNGNLKLLRALFAHPLANKKDVFEETFKTASATAMSLVKEQVDKLFSDWRQKGEN